MKKLFFFSLVAIATVTSCVKDKVTNFNSGGAIDFRVATTRATDLTTANILKFEATALKGTDNYFSKVEFSRASTSETYFNSVNPYFWPTDDSELTFYAYSPVESELTGAGVAVTINNTTKTIADFAPSTTVTDQVDLITAGPATGKKSTKETSGVELTFGHRLSKIIVEAKNSNTGYTVKVDGVRLVVPNSGGTFNIGTPGWTLNSTAATYDHTGSSQTLTGTAADMTVALGCTSFMLVPQALTAWDGENDGTNTAGGAYLALRINLKTSTGTQLYPSTADAYDWAAVGIDTNWEAGKCYKYVLDFTNGAGRVYPEKTSPVDAFDPGDLILGSPIKFTVTVSNWDTTPPDVDLGM